MVTTDYGVVAPATPMHVEVIASAGSFANPAALGLLGYGMSTVLLSLSNIGTYALGTMILAMAVFFGGIAQCAVALMAFRRGETFAVTAFGGYAFLWLTFAFLLVGNEHEWWATANSSTAMGWYLVLWSVFSLGMMIASLSAPRVLTGVLALTVVLLAVLAIASWTGGSIWTKAGGWEGVLTGAAAMYTAFAFVINESLGQTVLPVGTPLVSPPTEASIPPQRAPGGLTPSTKEAAR